MPEHYSSFGEAAGAAMAHNARTAARRTVERAAEEQTAEAPRNALDAPQAAEPPAPGPEQHPGGENGPHTGTQRADGERRQRYARALRTTPATGHTHKPGQEKWDHHPLPGEQGHRYTYTCALCRGDIDALATAVLAVAGAEQAELRAAVLREAIDVAREEGHRLEEAAGIESARGARSVAYLLRRRLVKAQRAAPQAGDDTTGETP